MARLNNINQISRGSIITDTVSATCQSYKDDFAVRASLTTSIMLNINNTTEISNRTTMTKFRFEITPN